MEWGNGPTVVGVCWVRPGAAALVSACGEIAPERVTPAMGAVTCPLCRAAIDHEIDALAGRVVAPWPYRVPPPPAPPGMASEYDLSDV